MRPESDRETEVVFLLGAVYFFNVRQTGSYFRIEMAPRWFLFYYLDIPSSADSLIPRVIMGPQHGVTARRSG